MATEQHKAAIHWWLKKTSSQEKGSRYPSDRPSSRMHCGWNRKIAAYTQNWAMNLQLSSPKPNHYTELYRNMYNTVVQLWWATLSFTSHIIYKSQMLCERALQSYRTWHNIVWQLSTTSECEKNINEAAGSLKCWHAAIKLHCIIPQQTKILTVTGARTSNVNYTSGPKCVIKSSSPFPREAYKTSDF